MEELEIISILVKANYKKINPENIFSRSSLKFHPATFRNLENDVRIYSFENQSGNLFYMWSFIYEEITVKMDWDNLEDSINFGDIQLYINEDNFLIPKIESINEVYHFDDQNTFMRPTINSIDNRIDLGDKRFIVSDSGILFSIHSKLEHKLLNYDNIISDAVKIILEKTLIGTLNAPFKITSCHLIPIDSSF